MCRYCPVPQMEAISLTCSSQQRAFDDSVALTRGNYGNNEPGIIGWGPVDVMFSLTLDAGRRRRGQRGCSGGGGAGERSPGGKQPSDMMVRAFTSGATSLAHQASQVAINSTQATMKRTLPHQLCSVLLVVGYITMAMGLAGKHGDNGPLDQYNHIGGGSIQHCSVPIAEWQRTSPSWSAHTR